MKNKAEEIGIHQMDAQAIAEDNVIAKVLESDAKAADMAVFGQPTQAELEEVFFAEAMM